MIKDEGLTKTIEEENVSLILERPGVRQTGGTTGMKGERKGENENQGEMVLLNPYSADDKVIHGDTTETETGIGMKGIDTIRGQRNQRNPSSIENEYLQNHDNRQKRHQK